MPSSIRHSSPRRRPDHVLPHNRAMWRRSIQVHLLAMVAAAGVVLRAQSSDPATYYPGRDWRTATPESQGIDSAALAAAIAQVRSQQLGVHSLLVVRHGFLVADVDFYPYSSAAPHDIASVT